MESEDTLYQSKTRLTTGFFKMWTQIIARLIKLDMHVTCTMTDVSLIQLMVVHSQLFVQRRFMQTSTACLTI